MSKFIWKKSLVELIVFFDILKKMRFLNFKHKNQALLNLFLDKDGDEINPMSLRTTRSFLRSHPEHKKKIEEGILRKIKKSNELLNIKIK